MEDSIDELSRSHDRLFPPSSPSKPNTTRDNAQVSAQSFLINTPVPAASRSTVSPVRIRVTVEAEPSVAPIPLKTIANINKKSSTMPDFDTGTTTITVPLKNEDEHKPVRRRGRPRKSMDAALTDTPKAKGAVKDEAHSSAIKVKRTPGRPRKNATATPTAAKTKRATPAAAKKTVHVEVAEFPDLDTPKAQVEITDEPIASRTRQSNAVGTTTSTTPTQEPPVAKQPAKRMTLDFAAMTPLHQKKSVLDVARPVQEMTFTPWGQRRSKEEVAARRIRERVPTPRKPRAREVEFGSPAQEEVEDGNDANERDRNIDHAEDEEVEEEEMDQEEDGENDESGEEDSNAGDDDDIDEEASGDDGDDKMTGLEDDTTMLDRSAVESEGFSMVSIDSLRSHRGFVEPAKKPQSRLRIEQHVEEEPAEVQTQEVDHQLPKISPRHRRQRDSHDGEIFGAFGAGTRRQLQARLAIGHMLAEQEESNAPDDVQQPICQHSRATQDDNDAFKRQYLFSGLSSPHRRKSRFAHSPDTASKSRHDEEAIEMSQTQLLQQEFQRERDEVIRQAALANASQIITLEDTTMQDVEPEEEASFDEPTHLHDKPHTQEDSGVGVEDIADDMWREEADRSMEASLIPRPARRNLKRQADSDHPVAEVQTSAVPNLQDLFPSDTRPPRAKIPRTWRRTSGADFLYSDEPATPAHLATEARQDQRQRIEPVPEYAADIWLQDRVEDSGNHLPARVRKVQIPVSRRGAHTDVRGSSRRVFVPVSAPAVAENNEQYFSESEQPTDNMVNEQQSHNVDVTFYSEERDDNQEAEEEIVYQSIEMDDTPADTSHARQVQQELLATTPARKRRFRSRKQENHGEAETHLLPERRSRGKELLRQPGKVYEPLFEPVAQRRPSPKRSKPQEVQNTITVERVVSTTFDANVKTEEKPSILNRLTSWLFTPAAPLSQPSPPSVPSPRPTNSHPSPPTTISTPAKTTAAARPTTTTPSWNRNHYLLLDHHYTRILHSPTAPLPSAYMTPWSSVPPALRKLVGTRLMTTTAANTTAFLNKNVPETYPATVTEQWVRIAYCFAFEAKERGVPVLCDGRFAPSSKATVTNTMAAQIEESIGEEWQAPDQSGYPVRNTSTGRVKRIKQDHWGESDEGAWDLVGRVYSLWVRDRMRGLL